MFIMQSTILIVLILGKDNLKEDSSDSGKDVDSRTNAVRAIHTSPHYRLQNQQRTSEWTFTMGLLYSVSLLTTVGRN